VIPLSNIDLANRIFNQRIGQGYVYGGSWDGDNIYAGTDCSGLVSMILAALTQGPAMQWGHPISTESWWFDYATGSPAEPGAVGPYGTIAVASLNDVPDDAVAVVSVGHHGGGANSHTQVRVQLAPGVWRMMEDNGTYGVCDETCGAMNQTSPYWTDYHYLPKETVTSTIFADVSEFQCPVDDSYTDAGYRVLSFRSNDGTHLDANFDANYAWATAACDAGKLDLIIVYFYWRPGQTGVANHMAMVNNAGGPHPRMVSMIDLESGGNPNYDQSAVLNDEYDQLVRWLGGNEKRVIGYANLGDERTMWQCRPSDIKFILAGYGANPYDPDLIKLAHQYTDGQGYGARDGLPDGAPPFGNCDMNSADGLDPVAFAARCGIHIGGTVTKPQSEEAQVSEVYDQLRISWPQLGGRSLVDAVAAIGAQLGISGFTNPGH